MEELKRLVEEELLKESNPEEQIRILQKIASKIINEYRIEVDDLIIEPLLVEAYYYHPGKFEDTSVHAAKDSTAKTYALARERQKNKFGELYVHYGTKDGIDIVLSQGCDYYLSFLIKTARIKADQDKNECAKQCAISENICGKCDNRNTCKGCKCKHYDKKVLKSLAPDNKHSEIVFLPRKGIKNDFANKLLAALSVEALKNKSEADAVAGSTEKGYQKQWQRSICALLAENGDEEKAREKARELNNGTKIEDKYWNLAKESLGYNKK